jgi:integrase
MSIYERKKADGSPTGSYIMELTFQGVKHKEASRDLQKLTDRQAAIIAGVIPAAKALPPAPVRAVSRRYTIGNLRQDALTRWKKHKNPDQSIQRFHAVCDILGDDLALEDVNKRMLEGVLAALDKQGLGDSTQHRYLAAFSAAYAWALDCELVTARPKFPWPKPGQPRKTTLDEDDEVRVFKHLKKTGAHDITLVMDFLLATGARIGEVLKLEPDDLHIKSGAVTFRDTKNGTDRVVFIESDLMTRLHALTLVGMPTYRRINMALHRARKALKLKYALTPHVLRHTVGTRLDRAGVGTKTIGELLGHKSLATTMNYIHVSREALKEVSVKLSRKRVPTGGES